MGFFEYIDPIVNRRTITTVKHQHGKTYAEYSAVLRHVPSGSYHKLPEY